MKILFVIPSLNSGGIEKYVLRLLRKRGRNLDCMILVRSVEPGELEAEFLQAGLRIVRMPLGYVNLVSVFRFYRFLRREGFNVVCDLNANFAAITICISWMVGVKRRIAFYRQGSDHFGTNPAKRIYNQCANRIVYYLATDILSNSRAALGYFFGIDWIRDNRFRVIYNGLEAKDPRGPNIRNELKLPVGAFVVGHCGRLDKAKNHSVILKTFQRLLRIDSSCRLVLIGEGTELLREECIRLNIEEQVVMLGYQSNVDLIMRSFDCFFFPSITEGQPNALIEAWLLEIPTVVSSIPSILEILPDGFQMFAKDAQDVEGFCELLLQLKMQELRYDTLAVRNHALAQFDFQSRSDEFFERLTASALD